MLTSSTRLRTYAGGGGSAQSGRDQFFVSPSCAGNVSSSWSWGRSGGEDEESRWSIARPTKTEEGTRTSAVAFLRRREGTRRALCEAARRRRCRGSVWKARFVLESLSRNGRGLSAAAVSCVSAWVELVMGAPRVLHGGLHRSDLKRACLRKETPCQSCKYCYVSSSQRTHERELLNLDCRRKALELTLDR